MTTRIDMPTGIELQNQKDYFLDIEKEQMRDQIAMLEAEIDRQSTIIDALIKAIKVIERG